MPDYIIPLLIIAAIFAVVISRRRKAVPSPPPTVEINGDSICSGAFTDTSCAKLLPPEWVVDDRAVAGLTLQSLCKGYSSVWAGGPVGPLGVQKRFTETAHPSQFVVISMGANDAYEGRDLAVFGNQLREMLMHIKTLGKTPVVTGIVPFRAGGTFDAATVKRAQALNDITHIAASDMRALDAHWDTVPFNPDTDTVDSIHRTPEAQRLLALRLQETIQAVQA